MVMGRPTKYDDKVLEEARYYADNYKDLGDVVPTIVGLCRYIKRSKSIVYDWAKDENKRDFSDIMDEIMEYQEHDIINKGLSNQINPQFGKMMMAKHGYSDRIEQDHTSSDGSMTSKTVVASEGAVKSIIEKL